MNCEVRDLRSGTNFPQSLEFSKVCLTLASLSFPLLSLALQVAFCLSTFRFQFVYYLLRKNSTEHSPTNSTAYFPFRTLPVPFLGLTRTFNYYVFFLWCVSLMSPLKHRAQRLAHSKVSEDLLTDHVSLFSVERQTLFVSKYKSPTGRFLQF